MKPCLALALLAGWVPISAADAPAEPDGPATPPRFTCALKRPMDECAFTTGADGVVLTITSPGGIGGARLTLTEGDAPRRLRVRFPKMRCLESFTVGDGQVALSGVMGCDSAFDKDGKPAAGAKDGVYFLKARQDKDKNFIEVEMSLPRGQPGAKQWDLSWVDAFRR